MRTFDTLLGFVVTVGFLALAVFLFSLAIGCEEPPRKVKPKPDVPECCQEK